MTVRGLVAAQLERAMRSLAGFDPVIADFVMQQEHLLDELEIGSTSTART